MPMWHWSTDNETRNRSKTESWEEAVAWPSTRLTCKPWSTLNSRCFKTKLYRLKTNKKFTSLWLKSKWLTWTVSTTGDWVETLQSSKIHRQLSRWPIFYLPTWLILPFKTSKIQKKKKSKTLAQSESLRKRRSLKNKRPSPSILPSQAMEHYLVINL